MDYVGLENRRCTTAQSDTCVNRWPGGLSSAAIDSLRQITEKKIGTNPLAQVTNPIRRDMSCLFPSPWPATMLCHPRKWEKPPEGICGPG